MGNIQRCPVLEKYGVPYSQSLIGGVLDYRGYEPKTLEERNQLRNICLECPYERCIYDMEARTGSPLPADKN